MSAYLDKIHPHILSDDKHVRSFILLSLSETFVASEETTLLCWEALDKFPESKEILYYTTSFPIGESAFVELLRRIHLNDDNQGHYLQYLEHCDTSLLVKYKDKVEPFMDPSFLEMIIRVPSMSEKELFMELRGLMNAMKEYGLDASTFLFGKRIADEIAGRGGITEREVLTVVLNEVEHGFTINGIYNIYLAGVLKMDNLVEELTSLLALADDEILTEEVQSALIKIGTDEVVDCLEKLIRDEANVMGIAVLQKIKSPKAEQVLLALFNEVDNLSIKTLIADALCQQLSVTTISKVAEMIETGYDEAMLDLEESIYACCVINGFDHPKLAEWKAYLDELDAFYDELSPDK